MCNLPLWYKRLHDERLLDVEWKTRSVISDNDHNRPFREVFPECECPIKDESCDCTHNWKLMWDRVYSSGYQIVEMNEGQTLLWMPLDQITDNSWKFYGLALYWYKNSTLSITNLQYTNTKASGLLAQMDFRRLLCLVERFRETVVVFHHCPRISFPRLLNRP